MVLVGLNLDSLALILYAVYQGVYTVGRLQSTLEDQGTMVPVAANYTMPDSPAITSLLCACLRSFARSFQSWCQQTSKLVGRFSVAIVGAALFLTRCDHPV